MKQIISSIIEHLKNLRRPVVQCLNKGLNFEEIKEKTENLDINLPDVFFQLYSTINGTRAYEGHTLGELSFLPGFYLLSLEDAINCYTSFNDNPQWDKSYFPIFSNGGGDFYCIVCNNINKNEAPILGFIMGEPENDIEYLSLLSMFQTILECYNIGAYYLDSEGYLEIDDDKELISARKYNPGVEIWFE